MWKRAAARLEYLALVAELGSVLSAHDVALDLRGRVDAHRFQQLGLLVTDGVRVERARHLHAEVGEHLEHVVLHHVAQHAGAVVVAAPPLHVDGLGHVELDVVDEVLVPQRLEHAVAEAEGQEILHRLLAEVVIDPVDLVLVPVGEHVAVQLQRGGQVGAERLLDDDPLPAGAVLEAGLVQLLADQAEEAGRGGEVEEGVAARLVFRVEPGDLGLERLVGAEVIEAGRDVVKTADEIVPGGLIEGVTRVELLDVVAEPRAERLGRERVHGRAQQREAVGQQAVTGEVVERRHQQALGQVARGAEDEHHARLARRTGGIRIRAAGSHHLGLIAHVRSSLRAASPSRVHAARPRDAARVSRLA
jgi:hypothetical protein